MELFITGFNSGLGKFLVEEFSGVKYDPRNIEQIKSATPKIVIHCGYRYPSVTDAAEALSQMELAKESLSRISTLEGTVKFIFISSIDVYPYFSDICFNESSSINLRDIRGVHSFLKLSLEQYVVNKFKNFLILRPALMLGNYIRDNSVTRILTSETCKLSIESNSTFNLISHQSVADFVQIARNLDLTGIYNLTSSTNISLRTIASLAGRQNIEFGKALYQTPQVDNSKVARYCKDFDKTSEEVLRTYMESVNYRNISNLQRRNL
jgi:dTDP-4-dehydrorhamnose reductase